MDMFNGDRQCIIEQDEETGESFVQLVSRETGERHCKNTTPPPRRVIRADNKTSSQSKSSNSVPTTIYNGASPRLLLILTSIVFPSVVTVLLIILELYLHIKCHVKNRTMKKEDFYYRSPFHSLTSKFCGACRESESALKVGILQDQRRNRYYYLQGIVS